MRVGIADDEELARERIVSLLAAREGYKVVVECRDGREAVDAILRDRLDLLFLDVKMPGLDGFEVIDAIKNVEAPVIVFVTAFDDFAVRAFDVSALDYLLKPFDRDRFEKTLARAQEALARNREKGITEDLKQFLAGLGIGTPREFQARFPVKSGGDIYFVAADEIDWIDAEGNYVGLHSKGKKHLVRDTIKSVEARLDPRRFVRVHRSAIINIDRLKKLQPYFHGEYVVTLQDGTTLTSSRNYSDRLRKLVE